MASADSHYTAWDPTPIYELGNAWIDFGDLLGEQLAKMSGAQFDLINGSWTGDSATSMSGAFYEMRNMVTKVVVNCWEMGEAINYYAILRTQQQAEQAKEAVAELISMIVGTVIGAVLGLGTLAITFTKAFQTLLTSLTRVLEGFGTSLANLRFLAPVVEYTKTATSAVPMLGPALSSMGSAVGIGGTILTEYTVINYASAAAGNAAAGVKNDWTKFHPLPVTVEGWAQLIAETGMPMALLSGGKTPKVSSKPGSAGAGDIVNVPTGELPPVVTSHPHSTGSSGAAGTSSGSGPRVTPNAPVVTPGEVTAKPNAALNTKTVIPDPVVTAAGPGTVPGAGAPLKGGRASSGPAGAGNPTVVAAPRPVPSPVRTTGEGAPTTAEGASGAGGGTALPTSVGREGGPVAGEGAVTPSHGPGGSGGPGGPARTGPEVPGGGSGAGAGTRETVTGTPPGGGGGGTPVRTGPGSEHGAVGGSGESVVNTPPATGSTP
ncbi:hypothetical protein B1H18_21320, partial [Streptomyces tsukubensis]